MNMAENGWLSVGERVPSMVVGESSGEGTDYLESDYVLVWDGYRVDIAQAISDRSGQYWLDRFSDVVEVFYWMPLPEPPAR